MDPADYFRIGFGALRGHRLRSFLSMLGIAIGITAVILLTSIGEGTRRYLITEFTQFGTNVLAINPGKTETSGLPGVFGGTTHKLTLDDSEALKRQIKMGVRVEQQALAKHGLNYVIDECLPKKMANTKALLP